jgi:hypothetical protein
MENDLPKVGYADPPPGEIGGKQELKKEKKSYPPPDRLVYTVRPSEEMKTKSGRIWGFIVVIIGIAAVAGILFAATYFNVPMPGGKTAVKSVETGGGLELSALEVEITRTMQLLDEMTVEFSDQPEKLEKVEELKMEAREILESIRGKTP